MSIVDGRVIRQRMEKKDAREWLADQLDRVVVATGPSLEHKAQCKHDEAIIRAAAAELRAMGKEANK